MAVKLNEIYKSNKKEMKLIAGKNGLNEIVRWVHMAEGINISVFRDEQELTFTTGIVLREKDELFELVKLCQKNKSSGMVINTGPFIKEISQEIIEFCDNNDFPLFEVTWDIYVAEIMKKICYQITLSERTNLELSAAIKNAIFLPEQKEMYVLQLERYSFRPEWPYRVIIIDIIRKDGIPLDDKRKDYTLKKIENFITYKYKNTVSLELNNKVILLLANYGEQKIDLILKELKENLEKLITENEFFFISIGNNVSSIYEIHKSYNQALNTIKIQIKKNDQNSIYKYQDLGIYKLLLSIENQSLIKEYYQEVLGEIEKNDKLNGTDYLEVLKCYLKYNGSVKAVAEELFYHKNTVGYKLQKIEQFLGDNLSYQSVRLNCNIALMLKEIFETSI